MICERNTYKRYIHVCVYFVHTSSYRYILFFFSDIFIIMNFITFILMLLHYIQRENMDKIFIDQLRNELKDYLYINGLKNLLQIILVLLMQSLQILAPMLCFWRVSILKLMRLVFLQKLICPSHNRLYKQVGRLFGMKVEMIGRVHIN